MRDRRFRNRARNGGAASALPCLFVALNQVVNLLAMHGKFDWRLNAELDGIALDAEDFHNDATVDDDAFIQFA